VRRAVVTILLAFTAFPASAQQVKNAGKPFARLADRVLHGEGHDSHLPPNISHELGLTSKVGGVRVKQIAFPLNQKEVIGFNVSLQNHRDIVIFWISDKAWTYYLTSPEGVLRKTVHFEKSSAGSAEFYPQKISSSLARDRFKKEKQCWLDVAETLRLAPACNLAEK
jgi:hypothetical protein